MGENDTEAPNRVRAETCCMHLLAMNHIIPQQYIKSGEFKMPVAFAFASHQDGASDINVKHARAFTLGKSLATM